MIGKHYLGMLNSDELFRFRFNYFRYRLSDVVDEADYDHYIKSTYDSFGEFISLGFVFTITPEGYQYWHKIRMSERDGVKYEKNELMIRTLINDHAVAENNDNLGETLEDVLEELNIKKQVSIMTKLQLDINPFLCTIDVSARINKVEERDIVLYSPLEFPQRTYASLGDKVFCINIDYTDSLLIVVTDEEDDSVHPFKLRVTK